LKTVLVVEDDGGARELYSTALENRGYRVATAVDGVAALRAVYANRPDAIVLDIALPRLGGRDVIRELRLNADTRTIPILIVTGLDIPDLSERMLVPVLKKPVGDQELVRAVDAIVDADGATTTRA